MHYHLANQFPISSWFWCHYPYLPFSQWFPFTTTNCFLTCPRHQWKFYLHSWNQHHLPQDCSWCLDTSLRCSIHPNCLCLTHLHWCYHQGLKSDLPLWWRHLLAHFQIIWGHHCMWIPPSQNEIILTIPPFPTNRPCLHHTSWTWPWNLALPSWPCQLPMCCWFSSQGHGHWYVTIPCYLESL